MSFTDWDAWLDALAVGLGVVGGIWLVRWLWP